MKKRGQNLGRAVSLLNAFWCGVDEDYAFGSAMGAPMGELEPILGKHRAKAFRKLRRRVKGITGLKWPAFVRELERRTSPRWVHFHIRVHG